VTHLVGKVLAEASGVLRRPQRMVPLIRRVVSDKFRVTFEQRHLYSYTTTKHSSLDALNSVIRWILDAQRPDGGIAAYYSLFSGYSESYPEVTGYIVPTLYDFARATVRAQEQKSAVAAAKRATDWLLTLQLSTGAFPGGLQGVAAQPSVFNTGQILQGLVRAYVETDRLQILQVALAAGDWLIDVQLADGSWSCPVTYQNTAHTYYSMVAWALAELSERAGSSPDLRYRRAAERNLDWVLPHFCSNGWVEGMNLRGHPNYLHFIAYALQGILECAILLKRNDAIEITAKSAWVLLRRFETNKFLSGAYSADFRDGLRFACLTGNAQVSCVWLRLYEVTGDLRYLNAALKIDEMLKRLIPLRAPCGIAGGVSGSYPIWGRYQPFRYISWGCKFLADALLLEQRLMQSIDVSCEALPCAS
jgi:hypothetical protein